MFTFLSIFPALLIPAIIALSDFVTIARSKKAKGIIHTNTTGTSEDFAVLVPIFGNISYLKNIDFLKNYSDHVVLCTTTKESEEFNKEIDNVAQQYGFKVFRSPVPIATSKGKPNPWRLFSNTLAGRDKGFNRDIVRDEIIKESFSIVTSKFCIFLDGDTYVKDSLHKLTGLMEEKKFDIASVRVLASKTKTIMEKLQAIEYELAMDARKIYPWLTSGAGIIAKTEAIKRVMKNHSLFFSGGDIEIGKLAGLLNFNVGHLHFEFFTEVPSTFKAWFKQRKAWFGGGFRHAIINAHTFTWRHPWFFIYTTVLVYAATPLRWYEVIKAPYILPLIIVLYWVLIFIFHAKHWGWHLLLFPFYSLMQVMILLPLGVYTYLVMSINSDNVGLIKLREKQQPLI